MALFMNFPTRIAIVLANSGFGKPLETPRFWPTIANYDSISSLWREKFVRSLEPSQLVHAHRRQALPVSRDEIVADDQRQIERFRHRLDAVTRLTRRTNHREIEAVRGADIAVDDRAVVQRDGDPERRLAVWRRPPDERGQRIPRSRERVRGCARRVVCRRRWEDREQAVADEFQYFAAVPGDG
jgi:hypothetical protein